MIVTTALLLMQITYPSVELKWTPSVSQDVTQQCLYRGTTPGGENYDVPRKCFSGNTTTSYRDRHVVSGQTYYYTVKAIAFANGTYTYSDSSNEASANP